ncbi:MAG: HAD family hydrolase [Coprobacillaceae bacterium]
MIENMKGIFIDLDDTLINFGGVTRESWRLTCEKMISEYPDISIDPVNLANKITNISDAYWADEDIRPKGNVDYRKLRTEIISQACRELNIVISKDALAYLLDSYAFNKEEAIYLFPNVYETLKTLREKGHKLVLITNGNSERQRGKIERFDLEKYFDLILIEGEQEFGKPDIRVYEKAIDFCEISKNQACMVGDNYLWEVETPIKYGMNGVWVNIKDTPLPEQTTVKPDLIIQNISELLKYMK